MTMQIAEAARRHYDRIKLSDDSKKTVMTKFRAINQLKEIAEDKVIEGDDWRSTYRLPELFGITERKKSDLIEHLPEVVVKSEIVDETNMPVAASAALAHFRSMAGDDYVKAEVISDAVDYGTGIKYDGVANVKRTITETDNESLYLEKGKGKEVTMYFGLAPERIDLRDAFPDPTATMDHDPAGTKGMQWFYRRLPIMSLETFKANFSQFNVSGIEGVDWGQVETYGITRTDTKRESEEKNQGAGKIFVVAFEGWDWVNDEHVIIANGQVLHEGALPNSHKRIPVTFYYNYKKPESLWGISEAEINAVFIYIKETLVNLMIDNAKLSQQPVIAVSGDVMFDPDENELEPGALFMLKGLNGGKVGDAIQPLTFGSSVEPANAVRQILEDLQIQITGDDSRSLTVSPNELATQTLAKREALKKRIRKNVLLNTIKAERNSVMQQFHNICQYLAKPYQDIDGKWKHHTIYVEDYAVSQRSASYTPEFTQVGGELGAFKLNDKTLNPQAVRFDVIEKVDDAVQKEQELQSLQWYMQNLMNFAQYQPQLLQNTDLEALAKNIGSYFTKLDVEAIFNSSSRVVDGMDEMGYFIQQMALGISPVIPRDGKNMRRLSKFRQFSKTKEYDLFNKQSKGIYTKALEDIVRAISEERNKPFNEFSKQRGMESPGQNMQQGGVPGSGPIGSGELRAADARAAGTGGETIRPQGGVSQG